ncbi:hypothetical protein [Lacipirellula parvula]|uniref:N-acetyltransferase domain-containing protein n=1 Tax=Lacipirellula parvula TaxID=2650471 RepID=A0A5K7X6N1_9BACT|nr:hypothetical protein [Lacipirellula parvula]BBO32240.1 hypothetical protein PLANPX_1852 [Lacipirellula parvula]
MGKFEFTLATADDDAELREVLSSTPMTGQISISFAREPNFFAATPVDGKLVQIVVGRDVEQGRIVGMGSRTAGPRYVNQQPTNVGYLGGLRLLAEYRGQGALIARGYRFLRQLHADRAAPYYLTTIAADNVVALKTITSGRAGLPTYHSLGDYVTTSLNPAATSRIDQDSSTRISTRLATIDDREQIITFLNAHGPRRQFFPAYAAADLFSEQGWLQGLSPGDVMLAFRDDQLVGVWGAWDQSRFKQTIIHSYSRWLALTRPAYNVVANMRKRATLPAPGSILAARYGAILVVAENDAEICRRLIGAMSRELLQRGDRLVFLGLHAADPLLPIARTIGGREYVTQLYLVFWPDQPPDLAELTQRVPYLELGCL